MVSERKISGRPVKMVRFLLNSYYNRAMATLLKNTQAPDGLIAEPQIKPLLEYTLPTEPAELEMNLAGLLAKETTKVSDAITLAIQEQVTSSIKTWFESTPKNLDKSLLKKIANSVASPGLSGEDRTEDALKEIAGWENTAPRITPKKAAVLLRAESVDYRKAKSYLAHQAKCVNALLKFFRDTEEDLSKNEKEILSRKIKSNEEFSKWAETLGNAWMRIGTIDSKNKKMYQSFWHRFTFLAQQGRADAYSLELTRVLKDYLNESHYDVFIQSLSKATLINRNLGVIKPALQNTLIAADDFIAIHATIGASDEKLLQMQQDLVFLFSQDQLLRKLNIEVSVTNTPGQTLVIRFATPKELISTRRAINGINSKIKRAFESN